MDQKTLTEKIMFILDEADDRLKNKKYVYRPHGIIRSDGKCFKSVQIACKKLNLDRQELYRAILRHEKYAGFFWEILRDVKKSS